MQQRADNRCVRDCRLRMQPDDLYLRERVGEYWVINPDVLNISRWRGHDDPGEVLSKVVEWRPEGMATPFVLRLAEFFADARS